MVHLGDLVVLRRGCLKATPYEKVMPLYRLMKKSETFTWTDEADQALMALKKALQEAPILAAPTSKEPMLLYIAATNRIVSTMMVVE